MEINVNLGNFPKSDLSKSVCVQAFFRWLRTDANDLDGFEYTHTQTLIHKYVHIHSERHVENVSL